MLRRFPGYIRCTEHSRGIYTDVNEGHLCFFVAMAKSRQKFLIIFSKTGVYFSRTD